MSEQATLDPNSPAALAALSEKRIAALSADGAKPKGEAPAATPPASDGDEPAAAPQAPDADAPNLSHIPEKYRSHFASIPAEALEWTRAGTVRHSTVSEAKKAAKEAEERAKAAESAAAAWRDFTSDQQRVQAMIAWDKKRAAGTPNADVDGDEEVPDFPNMTPKEIQAHIVRVASKAAADAAKQARTEAIKEVEAKYIAPATSTHAANLALAQYAKEHGYTPEQIQAATDKAAAFLERQGLGRDTWDDENAVERVEMFLSAQPAPKSTTNGSARSAAAAATPSRGGAAVAPSPAPLWQREGRAPNANERLGAIASTIEAMYGKRVTESQIADALTRR